MRKSILILPISLMIVLAFAACTTSAAQCSGGDPAVQKYAVAENTEPNLPTDQLVSLLRQHVRYLFVLYQENRSFDSYFGTFPGAEGLYSHPADQTPGYFQIIVNTDGSLPASSRSALDRKSSLQTRTT